MADQDDQGCAAARGILPRQPGEPPPEARVRRRRDGDAGGALLADGEAEVAALAAALRSTLSALAWARPMFDGERLGAPLLGFRCALCGERHKTDPAYLAHAADCPVAVLAAHDAARGEARFAADIERRIEAEARENYAALAGGSPTAPLWDELTAEGRQFYRNTARPDWREEDE